MIMTVQNGMPWWYFHGFEGPLGGTRLKRLDPSGLLERHIPGERTVGCVVSPAAAVTEPGAVKHVEGNRFPLGELYGPHAERVPKLPPRRLAPATGHARARANSCPNVY